MKEGDIVVNKIWARNGSVAVVPHALAGCFGSNEFPTFAPEPSKLDSRWIHWLTKTRSFWQQCDEKSQGTSGKNRIRPERFLEITLPLPPLEEQRRIVAKIDALAAKIEEVQRLQTEIETACFALCRGILAESHNGAPCLTSMGELVSLREPDVSVRAEVTYRFAGVYCFGRGVFAGPSKSGMEFKYPRLTRLRTGNFVYPKLMAWEGALGVVPPECDGLVVSTEFPVFDVHADIVLPEVLDTYFRTPAVWPELSGASTGTNVRRRRLNPADFLRYKFPLPSMATQQRMKAVRTKADEARSIRESARSQLEVVIPASLDRAFKGDF